MDGANAIGARGEHLVCADIRQLGYISFQAAFDCRYDIVADVGTRLIRVQVKTVANARTKKVVDGLTFDLTPSWHFGLRSMPSQWSGYRPVKLYKEGDYDILACVALDLNKIAYLPFVNTTTVTIRSRDYAYGAYRGNPYYFEDCEFEKVLGDLK